jgi:hypothetical protein
MWKGGTLFCANVGDSRTVLAREDKNGVLQARIHGHITLTLTLTLTLIELDDKNGVLQARIHGHIGGGGGISDPSLKSVDLFRPCPCPYLSP